VPQAQRDQFRLGLKQYASLITAKDALRMSGSKEGWLGNVDPKVLGDSVERNMSDGMVMDRASLAPVGRVGSAMRAGEALPESRGYIPVLSDMATAAAYARLNNPINLWAMQNPSRRAGLEGLLRAGGMGIGAELANSYNR
jgi:hypothetical protein